MIEPSEIEAMLRAAFPDGRFAVRDLTGTKDHFDAEIVAAEFASLSLLERHRLVYAALGDAMKQRIHALTLKTHTPEEARR
ncbi:MAG: BolA family transcriptional regulator [Polyangiaceae bacterium]|nr:BolA family transcriptional regulator [Polyangiaceae bacterium]